ncbi:hypothetical protein [uncultured Dokdonia sp.]|uniref:hypothetical protein n=1 Tax=uncultured Dokdonia sp. TaxID=575653 RepID=UPI00262F35A8|nr:hypothetical protein [uncultured Dokdonia sp.]
MTKLLLTIEEILSDVYGDDTGGAIELLDEYNLREVVNEKLLYLKRKTNFLDIDHISTFSFSLLKAINNIVLKVENGKDKRLLKYTLADIGNYLIKKLIEQEKMTFEDFEELGKSLREFCELEGYNYQDLERLLQIDRSIKIKTNHKNLSVIKNQINVYYEWNGNKDLLEYIIDNLKSEKIIVLKSEFEKLFSVTPKQVRIKRDSKDFIIVLFDVLKNKKLITPRGNKGHFVPLKSFAIDFDKKVLFKKEMKLYKQAIKKKIAKYNEYRIRAEKWIA